MKNTAALVRRLALVAALAAAAHAARGEDFEFEVPVQISKIDTAFTQASVRCDVIGMNRTANGQLTGGHAIIGSASTTFALDKGGYNLPVNVKVNANRPQHEPTDARSWNCGLVFIAPSGPVVACAVDLSTGLPIGRLPAILGLDPKSKVCTQGQIK
ncbi:MAG: hypothetical protein WCC53_02670 [Thermoanaerobaculia bacterium]|jgi:hypothetical protein